MKLSEYLDKQIKLYPLERTDNVGMFEMGKVRAYEEIKAALESGEIEI